uniref:CRAL-TRIO domain-containing protein n=1 Tax=Dracunculus medinensis TaxID=318479 RepID=A0A0N4UJK4_DRAME
LDEAAHHLERHLMFRQFFDLDNVENLKDNKLLKQYFPLGLVGKTGKNNHLLVVECAGRIDLHGILKTIQLNEFLSQRLKFQEMMLDEINKMEQENKSQCSVIYILDLEGLKLDSSLLSVVTGPYHTLWNLVYTNYPEWVETLFIVNAPAFISIIWKAIGPLMPERTRNKVQIFTRTKESLQSHCDLKYVPKHWGGELTDSNGDPMCRDRILIPTKSIPTNLYWQPDKMSPWIDKLESMTINAGRFKIVTIKVSPTNEKIFLALNRFGERSYSIAIYHSKDLKDMNEWIPTFLYPPMPTVDLLKVVSLGPGIYKFRFGNEDSWFRSVKLYYRIRFLNEHDDEIHWEQVNS